MSHAPDRSYSGRENLEAMRHARNYNEYLLGLIARHATGDTILDFGAGAGTFAVPLSRNGRNVLCVEPDAELQHVLAQAGLRAFGDLDSVPAESVDAIYSLNVLEHIQDDLSVLAELRQKLRPGGRLLLYVPAFGLLFSAMDRKVGHFRRYRRADLERRLRQAGFDIEFGRYADSLGFVATLVYKLIGDASGVLSPGSVVFYDRFVFPASRLADVFLGRAFGKNLVVLARRA